MGNFPPLLYSAQLTKLNRKKKQKNGTDHGLTTAPFPPNPIFNKSLSAAPFLKEFNSFCKNISDSGNVMA